VRVGVERGEALRRRSLVFFARARAQRLCALLRAVVWRAWRVAGRNQPKHIDKRRDGHGTAAAAQGALGGGAWTFACVLDGEGRSRQQAAQQPAPCPPPFITTGVQGGDARQRGRQRHGHHARAVRVQPVRVARAAQGACRWADVCDDGACCGVHTTILSRPSPPPLQPNQKTPTTPPPQKKGPSATPYEGGTFELGISVPEAYPLAPPAVRYRTRVFHPNVHFKVLPWVQGGRVGGWVRDCC
jgi:hypothetical protein